MQCNAILIMQHLNQLSYDTLHDEVVHSSKWEQSGKNSQGEAFFIVWEPVVCESDRKTESGYKTVMQKINRQGMEN